MSFPEHAGWPRQTLRVVQAPSMDSLADDRASADTDSCPGYGSASAWLWLDGAQSATLEHEVSSLQSGVDRHWLWRGTDWEYQPPGYRHGPLLTPVTAPLLQAFIDDWAPRQMGVLLFAGDDAPASAHLKHLRLMRAPDGLPMRFNLTATRQLEELCEGLPADRLAQLLGPIQRLIWRTADDAGALWLQADVPVPNETAPDPRGFALSAAEEDAVNRASFAYFMREAVRRHVPADMATKHPAAHAKLLHQIALFTDEAGLINLRLERDIHHYIELRLYFPQLPFEKDAELRANLARRDESGLLRLNHAEHRLNTITAAMASGTQS